MNFFVLRTPVFMEDVGRYFLEGAFGTRTDAREWIDG